MGLPTPCARTLRAAGQAARTTQPKQPSYRLTDDVDGAIIHDIAGESNGITTH